MEQDSSHALVGEDMYDGYTLAPMGQICRTTKAVQHLQELREPIATITVSLEQPFEASIVPNSMFEPIKRQWN